jgi:uncharacterized protein YfaP (DUF2135 family)
VPSGYAEVAGDPDDSDPDVHPDTGTGARLSIELTWETGGDDMDLHLLAPGGTLETGTDCYYANCTWTALDWGVSGETSDDPMMTADDISGTGPEIIEIEDPEDGEFTVVVHDYPGSSYTPENLVTVAVTIDGFSRVFNTVVSGEDTYTEICLINTATGAIDSLL